MRQKRKHLSEVADVDADCKAITTARRIGLQVSRQLRAFSKKMGSTVYKLRTRRALSVVNCQRNRIFREGETLCNEHRARGRGRNGREINPTRVRFATLHWRKGLKERQGRIAMNRRECLRPRCQLRVWNKFNKQSRIYKEALDLCIARANDIRALG